MSGGDHDALPHWRDVAAVIPEDFCFDGASSPFRWLYPLIYTAPTRVAIMIAARVHDFGYGPARLPGSPRVALGDHDLSLAALSKDDWDRLYRSALEHFGHPRVAKLHFRAVSKFGWRAWSRNAKQMHDAGWRTYADWLAARH